jgi:hypothetical protein
VPVDEFPSKFLKAAALIIIIIIIITIIIQIDQTSYCIIKRRVRLP